MIQRFIKYLLNNQIIFALFVVVLGWFIIQIRGIIVSIFLSYIIMAAVMPAVTFLRKKNTPKLLAVLIPYISIVFLLFLLIFPLVPFFLAQIQALISGFPVYLKKSADVFGFSIDPKQIEVYLSGELNSIGKNAFMVTSKVFGSLFSTITIFIVSFYLLMYHENFNKFIAGFFPVPKRKKVQITIDRINSKLGAWLRGQLLLCFFIGFVSWIALTILGLPYALPLALIAGVLEVIPTLGPTLSAVPAVIVALTISPTEAIIVILAYILIQALENHLLVPNIMQKAVGLNPVVVILGIMVGANLMGIPGALLSIPFISFVIVLLKSIQQNTNS